MFINSFHLLSIMTPEPGLIIWMFVSFAIVLFILSKWGWPIITGMADKRADYISESMKAAKAANKRLDEIKDEAQQILNEARSQQSMILKEATENRDKILAEAKIRANQETDRIMEETRRKLAIERENMLNDLRSKVAELSVTIAERVVRQELKKDENQRRVIDKMLDEIIKMN